MRKTLKGLLIGAGILFFGALSLGQEGNIYRELYERVTGRGGSYAFCERNTRYEVKAEKGNLELRFSINDRDRKLEFNFIDNNCDGLDGYEFFNVSNDEKTNTISCLRGLAQSMYKHYAETLLEELKSKNVKSAKR